MNVRGRGLSLLGSLLAGALLFPPGSSAQSGDGFLFDAPDVQITVHGGYARPEARSDLFRFVTEQLTLGRSDFQGVAAGAAALVPLTSRLGIEVSATYTGRGVGSEFREWVDQDDLPIEQRTLFVRVPLIASGRMYLVPPGRRIGSLAWIPRRVAPYVGAGAGAVWYRFRQVGDFVDYQDLSVFRDELDSDGWAPAAQATAGIDFSLTPRLAITTEGEYLWARANLGRDFVDYEPIDLAGFNATIGITVRL